MPRVLPNISGAPAYLAQCATIRTTLCQTESGKSSNRDEKTMEGFWDRWGSLIQRLVASVGSQASLLALVLVFMPQPVDLSGWPGALALAAGLLAFASICLEFRADKKAHNNRKTYEKDDVIGIKSYMRSWIGDSGRAIIWTRDLSWADDDSTKKLLKEKAQEGNLTVCMPKMTELGEVLRAAGANVWIYGRPSFLAPASRFTIAHFGNGGSQVAIGRGGRGIHVIEEIDSSHPALHMAIDLASLAELLHKENAAHV